MKDGKTDAVLDLLLDQSVISAGLLLRCCACFMFGCVGEVTGLTLNQQPM